VTSDKTVYRPARPTHGDDDAIVCVHESIGTAYDDQGGDGPGQTRRPVDVFAAEFDVLLYELTSQLCRRRRAQESDDAPWG
jgi:hypothetical protein